jgi:hypothetical protein
MKNKAINKNRGELVKENIIIDKKKPRVFNRMVFLIGHWSINFPTKGRNIEADNVDDEYIAAKVSGEMPMDEQMVGMANDIKNV